MNEGYRVSNDSVEESPGNELRRPVCNTAYPIGAIASQMPTRTPSDLLV
jgi:hypothetical protein